MEWDKECDERGIAFDEWFLIMLKEKTYRVYV